MYMPCQSNGYSKRHGSYGKMSVPIISLVIACLCEGLPLETLIALEFFVPYLDMTIRLFFYWSDKNGLVVVSVVELIPFSNSLYIPS